MYKLYGMWINLNKAVKKKEWKKKITHSGSQLSDLAVYMKEVTVK